VDTFDDIIHTPAEHNDNDDHGNHDDVRGDQGLSTAELIKLFNTHPQRKFDPSVDGDLSTYADISVVKRGSKEGKNIHSPIAL